MGIVLYNLNEYVCVSRNILQRNVNQLTHLQSWVINQIFIVNLHVIKCMHSTRIDIGALLKKTFVECKVVVEVVEVRSCVEWK